MHPSVILAYRINKEVSVCQKQFLCNVTFLSKPGVLWKLVNRKYLCRQSRYQRQNGGGGEKNGEVKKKCARSPHKKNCRFCAKVGKCGLFYHIWYYYFWGEGENWEERFSWGGGKFPVPPLAPPLVAGYLSNDNGNLILTEVNVSKLWFNFQI